MKKGVKKLIIAASVVGLSAVAYSSVWYYFYKCVWMCHVENSDYSFSKEVFKVTRETKYRYSDETDEYYISVPKFGSFDCHVGTCCGYLLDTDHPITDETGTTYNMMPLNGSSFGMECFGKFKLDGSIEQYDFTVRHYPESDTSYPSDGIHVLVSPDGELLNEDELSDEELLFYQEASSEVKRFLTNTKSIFCIS